MGSADTNEDRNQRLDDSSDLIIDLLGEPRVVSDGVDIAFRLPYDKLRLLLGYWLTEGRSSFLRSDLSTLFWPDAEPGQARSSLRKALSHLRRVFTDVEPPVFDVERDRIRMLRHSAMSVDTKTLTEVSNALETDGETISTEKLQATLALYRSDFLSGIKVRNEEELEAWLHDRRLDYRRRALHICQTLVSRLRDAGKPDEAVLVARRGMEIDGDDEAMHVALLRALKDAGQTTVARIESDRFIAHLTNVLDVEPSEALQAIRQTLPQGTAPAKDTNASRERRWSAVVLRVEHRGLGSPPALRRARQDLAELVALVASQGRGYRLTAGADGLETLTFGYPCADSSAIMQALDATHRLLAERDDLAIAIEQGAISDDVEPTDNPVGDVFGITTALLARCSAGEILVGERAASAAHSFYRLTRPSTLRTRTRPSLKLTYWRIQGRHGLGEVICRTGPSSPKVDKARYAQATSETGLLLQGEIGAGKTYALNGLIEFARRGGVEPLVLQCLPGDRLRPLGAFARWLRGCIGPGTPVAELPVRRALVHYLGERRENLESMEPLVVTLLTELILRNERMRLGRGQFDAEMLASRLAPVFHALFSGGEGVLFVDNVDEADDFLLGWLNGWVQAGANPGRFVMTCRDVPAALVLPKQTPVEGLKTLSHREGRRLITGVCGAGGIDKASMADLLALAAGNPGRLIALAEWHIHRRLAAPTAQDAEDLPPRLLMGLGGRMASTDGLPDEAADLLTTRIWSCLFNDPDEAIVPGASDVDVDGLPGASKIPEAASTLLASR